MPMLEGLSQKWDSPFFTLDIATVHNIDIPSKSPFGKGGLWSLRSTNIKGYMGK